MPIEVQRVVIAQGIHFAWVPDYVGSKFAGHWMSVGGHRVRLFSPSRERISWLVTIHADNNLSPDADNSLACESKVDAKEAIRLAGEWAQFGLC